MGKMIVKKLINIDKELWSRFRKKCVNEDVLIQDQLPALIKRYLDG